jgi:glucose-1-phosphate thymidylyltransferase
MTAYKGIVLAGGSGTRLFPITLGTSKQLLPVYDKPMIYYPLSVLMLAGIKDILLISTPEDINSYQRLLGSGEQFGINLTYEIQKKPRGLAEAFIIGEKFIGADNVALILGDNIFFGHSFSDTLSSAQLKSNEATIFGYHVPNPSEFGVVELDKNGDIKNIVEKPLKPISNIAVTGLYFYDNDVINISKAIKPSKRGELEITDINNHYLNQGKLNLQILGRGFAWLDTGNPDALLEAGTFVQSMEHTQGLKIACLEEIAYRKNWIDINSIAKSADILKKTDYGKYLQHIIKE